MASDLSAYISQEGLNQFFLDVRENLDLLESSLLEMENFPEALEPRQSFLRAIHSIKGTAHMFGYEEIAHFCHLLEDVHIPVQRGERVADDRLISQTLKARDLLDQLLEGQPDPDLQNALYEYFTALAPKRPVAPVVAPEVEERPAGLVTYRVRFRFDASKEIFYTATNPLWYLRALADMGDLRVHCQVAEVPPLEAINPGVCYLCWECSLTTTHRRSDILAEFVFVEDDLAELVVEVASVAAEEPVAQAPPEDRLLRILIADDDFNNRMVLRGILQPYGDCDMVVDGAEAVEIFEIALTEDRPYDLILLDIMMPVMDGYVALQQIREVESKHGVKPREETTVIMVTALDSPRSVFRAYYTGGCTDYIVKPVTRSTVLTKLKKLGLVFNA